MSSRPQTPKAQLEAVVSTPSVWTSHSVFADSAISVGSTSPPVQSDAPKMKETPPRSPGVSISNRLTQLAAAAWAVEQDSTIDSAKRDKVSKALDIIEASLEDREDVDVATSQDRSDMSLKPINSANDTVETDPILLQHIHDALRSTVTSMRLRQQEQRHLHQLSIQKLEAVAHTCLVQEKELSDLKSEVRSLRGENKKLGEENDDLLDLVAGMESEIAQQHVAVNAMSSAVAGLEGWINNSSDPNRLSTSQTRRTPRKSVMRGHGRFRGRHYVDVVEPNGPEHTVDTTMSTKDLHDGMRAWLRGFRDVEEELHRTASNRSSIRSKEGRSALVSTEEEWGEFAVAAT